MPATKLNVGRIGTTARGFSHLWPKRTARRRDLDSPTAGVLRTLRALRSDLSGEQGQALVLTAITMVVLLGFTALALDVSSWYQRHHQTQVAVDAASLAAANCLADGANGSGTCTSTTDTTDAAQVATTIAADNGVTIPTSAVSFNLSSGTVTINASQSTPALFASVFGVHSTSQAAKAVASFAAGQPSTVTTITTTNPAAACNGDCGAIFAGGSCESGTGVQLSSISGTIQGSVISDANLSLSSVSGTINGTDNYGPSQIQPSYCSSSYSKSSISGTVPTPTQLTSVLPYPEDWRSGGNESVPGCTFTASSSTAGTYHSSGGAWVLGGSGTDTMTVTSTNITMGGSSALPPGVYCAPSGTLTLSSYSGGQAYVTFIAQTITFSSVSGGPFYPCTSSENSSCPSTNILLMYMTGSGTLNLGSLSGAINGTIFAPSATLSATSISGGTGFLEANSVTVSSLSGYVGNGPSNIASGGSGGTVTTTQTIPGTNGTDALIG